MSPLAHALLWTGIAGAAIPAGGLLARIERIRPDWLEREFRHGVVAFGGGVLLAAVALVLVPEGIRHLPPVEAAAAVTLGGLAFLGVDLAVARSGASAGNLLAMLADFVPEALALGATVASRAPIAMLLGLLIALQNLPEGFNTFRELVDSGFGRSRVLAAMAGTALLGPVAGWIGLRVLAGHQATVSAIMLFAAGGILYLLFQDIAPQARLERRWLPPFGAVLGFVVGLVGQMLVG